MINKLFDKLKLIYIILLSLIIISFILVVLHMDKNLLFVENEGLERWSIILTLACIFGSFRLLQPNPSEVKSSEKAFIQFYTIKYLSRFLVLIVIYTSNLTCYFFTGAKNFIYLSFIVIFAIFLCAPNKKTERRKD